MKTKILVLSLALTLIFTACGENKPSTQVNPAQNQVANQEQVNQAQQNKTEQRKQLTQQINSSEFSINYDEKGWKIYKNEKFHFNFKYPSELKFDQIVGEGDNPKKLGTAFFDENKNSKKIFFRVFEPSTNNISDNVKAKKIDDYKKNYFVNSERKIVIIKQEEVLINGNKALKQLYAAGTAKEKLKNKIQINDNDFDEYGLEKAGFFYEKESIRYIISNGKGTFILLTTLNDNKDSEKILDAVAKTFKFN